MLRILAREKKAVFSDGLSLLLIATGLYLFFASLTTAPGLTRAVPRPPSPASALEAAPGATALSRPPPPSGASTSAGSNVTYVVAGQEWDATSRANVDRAL